MKTEERRKRKPKVLLARTRMLLIVCGIVVFMILAVRLYQLQVIKNSHYESMALQFQLKQTNLAASRGTIFDVNGKILAMSTAVENVFISPFEIDRDGHDINFIADGLSQILGVDSGFIIASAVNLKSQYQVIKFRVENDEASLVRDFIKENKLTGIYFEPTEKRYYPNNNLASQVLGFVGNDGNGLDGLEQRYDNLLTGIDGRNTRLKNARGTELLLPGYDDSFAAQDGNNITLTIDSTIQYYAEKHLEQAITDYDVQNGATCIVMNAKTGAVLALANYPNYDPNNFLLISDSEMEKLSRITDADEYSQALFAAQLRQWRNRSLTDTYEPGSVFKLITLAIALEEGVTYPGDGFFCSGSMNIMGREPDDPLNCWQRWGHGAQTLNQAVQNSCNCVSAELSLRIGARRFYKYIDAFGLFNKTGLDNNIEGRSLWWDESVFYNRYNQSQLASASFGQTFKVTPIQMITAAAAVVNGGYLLQPYIVQQITDSNGDIIDTAEPNIIRQVISNETSVTARGILEEVVTNGTGKNARVRGYRIGGKTGTSENVEQLTRQGDSANIAKDYIVSFMGFAPADDPEIIILLLLDTPSHKTGLYISGGGMAAPVVGNMFADILPLSLGIRPQYTEDDLAEINVDVPRLTGRSIEDAQEILTEAGFGVKVVGDGISVTNQLPMPNGHVAWGTTVILYADEELPKTQVNVPLLTGMSYLTAKQSLENRGLFIRTTGASRFDGKTEISVQSIPEGEQTAYGTIIEVRLISKDAVARN